MQTYTIKKVSVETEAGFIYNFEDLPQDNIFLKIRPLIISKNNPKLKEKAGKESSWYLGIK